MSRSKILFIFFITLMSACSDPGLSSFRFEFSSNDSKLEALRNHFGEDAIFENEFLILGDRAIRIEDFSFEELREPRIETFSSVYGNNSRWPGGIVPIQFKDRDYESQIWEACRMWSLTANVKCVQRSGERAFVEIQTDRSTSSNFASRGFEGQRRHVLNLVTSIDALHEMGHIFGLRHEHQRSDRNEYLTVNFERIRSGSRSNFEISPRSGDFGEYDFLSVMHYGPFTSARSDATGPVLEVHPRYQKYQDLIGDTNFEPSFGDARSMRNLYGAPSYQDQREADNALSRRCSIESIQEPTDFGQITAVSYCMVLDRLPSQEEKLREIRRMEETGDGAILLVTSLARSDEFVKKHHFLFLDYLTRQLILHRVMYRRNAKQEDLEIFANRRPILQSVIIDIFGTREFEEGLGRFLLRQERTNPCSEEKGVFSVCRPDVARCTQTLSRVATKTVSIYRALERNWNSSKEPQECTLAMLRDSPTECGACNVYRHLIANPGRAGFESGAKWLASNSSSVRDDLVRGEAVPGMVQRMYQQWLGRPADSGGLNAHTEQILGDRLPGLRRSIEAFVRSSEFRFD